MYLSNFIFWQYIIPWRQDQSVAITSEMNLPFQRFFCEETEINLMLQIQNNKTIMRSRYLVVVSNIAQGPIQILPICDATWTPKFDC